MIIDGITSHSSLLDSYVVLYAAFVSSLHKIVGVEFGLYRFRSFIPCWCVHCLAAYFIQNTVSSYDQFFGALQATSENPEESTAGKEASNLIVLLSELYNFQVISSVLIFDIIRGLLDINLTEFGVELLLKILRSTLFCCLCVLTILHQCIRFWTATSSGWSFRT